MNRVLEYTLLVHGVHSPTGELFNGRVWRKIATIALICHATGIRSELSYEWYRLSRCREADDITDNIPTTVMNLNPAGLTLAEEKAPRSIIPVDDFIPSLLLRHSALARVLSSTFLRMLHPVNTIQSCLGRYSRLRYPTGSCTSSDGLTV